MGRIGLAAVLSAVLLATGCVTAEKRVPKSAAPDPGSGYVGGIFSKDTVAGFGFGLRDLGTQREYVLAFDSKDVSLIAVPPGKYRVAYWITFAALTHEKLTKKDFPANHPLGRTFEVGPGQVILVGKWSAERELWLGGNTYRIVPAPISESEALAAFRAEYPGFGPAPAACLLCAQPRPAGPATPAPGDLATLEQACESGRTASCTEAGRRHEAGRTVPRDPARAVALFRRGCEGGDAAGCRLLGDAYAFGMGVDKDAVQSVKFLSRGCDLGDQGACSNLGAKYSNGDGVAKDEARAAKLFRSSCDAGYAGGCLNLALALRNGRGVPKDLGAAPPLYAKACDGGVARGCTYLAGLHQRGEAVPKDLTRAAALYDQGCDGGDALGCYHAGYFAEQGLGTQRDARRAGAAYKRACDGGETKACERLARLKAP
jgi:TPR repeat protein